MEETKKKRGRKPSGFKFVCIVVDVRLHTKLRALGDYLERETGEKFSMGRIIEWTYTNAVPDEIETETPDGEL